MEPYPYACVQGLLSPEVRGRSTFEPVADTGVTHVTLERSGYDALMIRLRRRSVSIGALQQPFT